MFDPNQYWLERGKSYASEARLDTPYYREQAQFFADTVKALNPKTILEAACGFGRVTKAMSLAMPGAQIEAFDLSADQIAHAPTLPNVDFRVRDVRSITWFFQSDVAVAAELFQHHPAETVKEFVGKLLNVAPVLVHDFNVNEKPGDPTAEHCFAHDWEAIYRDLGASVEAKTRGEHGLIVARR